MHLCAAAAAANECITHEEQKECQKSSTKYLLKTYPITTTIAITLHVHTVVNTQTMSCIIMQEHQYACSLL